MKGCRLGADGLSPHGRPRRTRVLSTATNEQPPALGCKQALSTAPDAPPRATARRPRSPCASSRGKAANSTWAWRRVRATSLHPWTLHASCAGPFRGLGSATRTTKRNTPWTSGGDARTHGVRESAPHGPGGGKAPVPALASSIAPRVPGRAERGDRGLESSPGECVADLKDADKRMQSAHEQAEPCAGAHDASGLLVASALRAPTPGRAASWR